MPPAVLIVEPYESFASQLVVLAEESGWEALVYQTFETARRNLESRHPDFLFTNVRLGPFNGIQLCYLIKRVDIRTPAVVYASEKDFGLAADAQQACGFFERQSFLPYSMSAYLKASLPDRDRRNPDRPDRRATFRGGRRATDLPFLHPGRLPPSDQPPLWPPPDNGPQN